MRKIYILLLISIFLFNSVSADLITWDNYKTFTSKGEYGKIDIFSKGIFGFGEVKLREIELSHNTKLCNGNICEAIFREVKLYENQKFFDDIRFIDLKTGEETSIRGYKVYVKTGETIKQEDINKNSCSLLTSLNGSKYNSCINEKIGTKNIIQDVWAEFNPNVDYDSGTYNFKIVGELKSNQRVDWQIKIRGQWTEEWANWASSTLNNNVLSYYKLDESGGVTTTNDSLGRNNITGLTGQFVSNGKINNSLRINDTFLNTGIQMLSNNTIGYTFSAFMNMSTRLANVIVPICYGNGQNPDENGEFRFYSTSGNPNLTIDFNDADGRHTFVLPNVTITNSTWDLWTWVFNRTTLEIYKNGSKVYNNVTINNWNNNFGGTLKFGSSCNNGDLDGNKTIDEISVWNRTLTSAEVYTLYQSNRIINNSYPFSSDAIVIATSPSNQIEQPSLATLNCSADIFSGGNVNLTNISLYTNISGSFLFNQTVARVGVSNISNYSKRFTNGQNYLWGCQACDTDGACGFSTNRTLLIDGTSPSVNITEPKIIENYAQISHNQSFNYTSNDTFRDSCWIQYNDVNRSVSCTANSSIILTTNKTVKFCSNDTSGNVGCQDRYLNYKLFRNSQSFNATTFETHKEGFSVNLTYNTTYNTLSGILNYNGSNYSSSKTTSANDVIYTTSINIPEAIFNPQNNSFRWIVDLQNASSGTEQYATTYSNQTVSKYIFTVCNVTTNATALNFTVYDELNNTPINYSNFPVTFRVDFNYWAGTGETYSNYSYQSVNDSTRNSFAFCFLNSSNTLQINMDSEFSAEGYSSNNYHFRNLTIVNNSANYTLYVIDSDDATKFYVTVKKGVEFLEGALVTLSKQFIGLGQYITTGIKLTDTSAQFPAFLVLDAPYNFGIVRSGEFLGVISKGADCSVAPCTIDLNLEESTGSVFTGYNSTYAGNVLSNLTYNRTTYMVNYNFYDLTGGANYFRLLVKSLNTNTTSSNVTICDTSSFTTFGTITCNLTGREGEFIADSFEDEKKDLTIGILISDILFDDTSDYSVFILVINIVLLITTIVGTAVITRGSPSSMLFMGGIVILLLKIATLFPFSWIVVVSVEAVITYFIIKLKI